MYLLFPSGKGPKKAKRHFMTIKITIKTSQFSDI